MKSKLIILWLAVLLPLWGCAGLPGGPKAAGPADTAVAAKGGEEILVAEDFIRGWHFFFMGWCGNSALLFAGHDMGVVLIDLVTKKRIRISEDSDDRPLNCTPDGRWVLYHENEEVRTEKGGDIAYDEFLKKQLDVGAWTYYMYRYDVETGKREKVGGVGVDEGGWYEALSPDGKKILLGNRHTLNTELYVPGWEPVWFANYWWGRQGTRWFSDSSGVVLSRYRQICVEFFGEDGWVKCFPQELKYDENISELALDKEDRIYFQSYVGGAGALGGLSAVHRCELKGRELLCEQVSGHGGYDGPLAFLPDGDLVYQYADGCIMRGEPWHPGGECIVGDRPEEDDYVGIEMLGVSPDGRWLAFERLRKELRISQGWPVRLRDLFVIDLEKIKEERR